MSDYLTHDHATETCQKAYETWAPGSTFYKSGDECTVIKRENAGVWYLWPDGDPELYFLTFYVENDEQLDDWSDVELS